MDATSLDPDRLDVLYVEDEPLNVMLMDALFQRRPDLRLSVAIDGTEALDIAPTLQPCVLLLDLNLPDCYGVALLHHLRTMPGYASVPAVAVTSDYGFRVGDTGFIEVWNKPLHVAHVLARLDALVAAYRSGRMAAQRGADSRLTEDRRAAGY